MKHSRNFKQPLRYILPFLLLTAAGCGKNTGIQQNIPVDFSHVEITDDFWQPRLKMHATVTLPACIHQCEVETQRIGNFAIAAGMEEGVFKGLFYDDSDLYKMIEGASCSLKNNPDPALEKKLDEIIGKIAGAQMEDGYLMTYYILGNTGDRWTDMDKHEMYCCGHLIEAAIAFYNATGKRTLLDVAVKYADHIDNTFGPGKRTWVPGHQEIELALIKLYRTAGEKRYLTLAHWLLEQRGHDKADWRAKDYYQDLMPVAELEKISGHAVRAMYMFTGMADYTAATSDTTYMAALDRLWNDVVNKKMYVTGGIGSSRRNEGFTEEYDLPNEEAYCETCASVGMVMWNQRMNSLTGESRYADVMERSMYNGALAGISLSGDRFFYVNPLASQGDHHRQSWYGTACCPSQISRFLPSIGNYIYALSDDAVWVNLYIGSSASLTAGKTPLTLTQQTRYPWEGGVKFSVEPEKPCRFALRLRIPGWCRTYGVTVNGAEAGFVRDRGYAVIDRTWSDGDIVEIAMGIPVEVIEADPRVKADMGRRAIQRGPLVYCLEQTDNPGFDDSKLTPETGYTAVFESGLLGGIETITAVTDGTTLKFIPYYAWDNREAGKMEVWVDYEDRNS